MLTVRRSRLYTRWFSWYARRQFRRHFHLLRVAMPEEVTAMKREVPVIFYGNHAYWWDGFWSQLCAETFFTQNLYIIIELQQLIKYRFFTRLGAFSIDRSHPRSAVRTIKYASECLSATTGKQNALWIFPQGVIRHVDERPIRFFRGTADIVSRVLENCPEIYLVSVVSRIEYLEEQKPELFLSFRTPQLVRRGEHHDRTSMTRNMESVTEDHLDDVKEHVMLREFDGYSLLVRGKESVNRKFDRYRKSLHGDRPL